MTDKRQITLAITLMAIIAVFFWTQSRFPALDTKAQMGQRTSISAIAFDVVMPVEKEQPYLERVSKSAINWGYTNWKGMTFGLIFAAAFFTLLRLIPPFASSRFHFINSLKGMVIGVPLGVCANCSTPIAHGMVKAGTRIETALATLMSSPTLNIFVLSMAFSLLPFHLAVIKLLGVFVFVLIFIPILVKRFVKQDIDSHIKADNFQKDVSEHPLSKTINTESSTSCELPSTNWAEAVVRVTRNFSQNLWLIVKATLPLMILAGILGAFAIETISFSSIAEYEDSILALIGVSIIGAFLPVPIAFDIIIVTTLIAAGFPVGLAMALLFSLGIFSIYPAMVIARNVSATLSVAIFAGIILMACITGLVAERYNRSIIASATNAVADLTQAKNQSASNINNNTRKSADIISAIASNQCGTLNNPTLQQECITDALLIPTTSKKTQTKIDPLSCNEITDQKKQLHCFSLLSEAFAIESGDLAKCNAIHAQKIQHSCKKTIVLHKVRSLYDIEVMQSSLTMVMTGNTPASAGNAESKPSSNSINDKNTQPILWKSIHKQDNVEISSPELTQSNLLQRQDGSSAADPRAFQAIPSGELGINLTVDFSLSDFFEPFKYGRGIASGDITNNGYPDLVFATATGPVIFINKNGTFQEQTIPLPEHLSKNTFLITFADFNNDGWLDLFFGTYGGKNYILTNDNGIFNTGSIIELPNIQTSLTMAAGFIDKDRDGDLDIYIGNWTAGAENNFSTQHSQNAWLINTDNDFSLQTDTDTKGETLSVLFSDFTNDNIIDHIVANDNQAPDLYYQGTTNNNLRRITANGIIPVTSLTTMSIDTADFNNDLLLDIFTSDMTFGEGNRPSYCELINTQEGQEQCKRNLAGWYAIKKLSPQHCSELVDYNEKQQCINAFIIHLAKTSRDTSLCDKIAHRFSDKRLLCQRMASKLSQDLLPTSEHIPQAHKNKLLIADKSGQFIESAKALGVQSSYWSWNSKAADLDNDGWQDIFIANGFGFGEIQNEIHSNVFFHNQNGKGFKEAAALFGLEQHLNTPTYTYADLDLDGDIDIVSTAIMDQPHVYLNTSNDTSNKKSISFTLRDHIQNRYCVGCKIIISYGDNEKQLREIKLSGGFMSFDAPIAHFGVGKEEIVNNVEVIWSDGIKTTLSSPLNTEAQYKISRH